MNRVGNARAWRLAQVSMLGAAFALLGALVFRPEAGLRLMWAGIVPALPAVWLVHPAWWRNVCPLATLQNVLPANGERRLAALGSVRGGTVGLVLFVAALPLRHGLLNHSGPSLALVLAGAGALAAVRGRGWSRKSGFCNTICPAGIVERLYGQTPLGTVSNPRCPTCTLCTPRGCPDLAAGKALPQLLGPSRADWRWLTRPHGAFAGAFPGLVAGYFLTADGSWPALFGSAAVILSGGAASWIAVLAISRLTGAGARTGLPLTASLAFALFYLLGAARFVEPWGGGGATAWAVRGVALVLLLAWWIHRILASVQAPRLYGSRTTLQGRPRHASQIPDLRRLARRGAAVGRHTSRGCPRTGPAPVG